ncbi:glycerophosphodiester phosphodiesterase family protein [Pseudovibrio exalbescens]|uniref:glycerophosphodiester phosphodiesterase family protein n=1 Tax=Pseudovibrio exalbescens TaxID=197461 RepID=UPI000C9C69B6|nr:glycerophosphodiester phosphodiesterase family protein [Pseudovibrio exalbescens]
MLRWGLAAFGGLAATLYLTNASWIAGIGSTTEAHLIAHRGVHQTYHRENLADDTCTATRIDPPKHGYLENTIASMKKAVELGADVVEIDIHPTTDGKLAVFHDWTLECRSNASGETRSKSMSELKALDIGWGYTADDGQSFPFRGTGTGLMPDLTEVFDALPEARFLINYKSKQALEAEHFVAFLQEQPERLDQVWGVYGHPVPVNYTLARVPNLHSFTKQRTKQCLKKYFLFGWSGYVPSQCRGTVIGVPSDYTWMVWGWPNRFAARLKAQGSTVIAMGPVGDTQASDGLDSGDAFRALQHFDGYIWTNKIEVLGPLSLKRRD